MARTLTVTAHDLGRVGERSPEYAGGIVAEALIRAGFEVKTFDQPDHRVLSDGIHDIVLRIEEATL